MPPSAATTVGIAVPTTVASSAARNIPSITPAVTAFRRPGVRTRCGRSGLFPAPAAVVPCFGCVSTLTRRFLLYFFHVDRVDRERRAEHALQLDDRLVVVGERPQLAGARVREVVLTREDQERRRETRLVAPLLARELDLCGLA